MLGGSRTDTLAHGRDRANGLGRPQERGEHPDARIDFADLDAVFDGRPALVVEDGRRDYGERRFNMLVELHGVILNVTFTPRPPKHRVISARLASRKERGIYHAAQEG